MKKIISLLLIIIVAKICGAQSVSPEVISAAGDYFTNGTNALSWTIGESAVETFSNSNNILTQGFQQPQYVITDITENKNSEVQISIFPNPSNDLLNISIKGLDQKNKISVDLFDVNGKLILQNIFAGSASSLSLPIGKLPVAFYLLKISVPEKHFYNTYKIQKLL